MGRLRSKRKLKQCDPFYKVDKSKPQIQKDDKYDLPIVRNRTKRKKRIPTSDDIEREVLGYTQPKAMELSNLRPGENVKDFYRRMNQDVRNIITSEAKKSSKQREKRNSYFEKKKNKKKASRMSEQEKYELEREERNKEDFRGAEKIPFGEVAQRPPTLPKLKFLKKTKKVSSLKKC